MINVMYYQVSNKNYMSLEFGLVGCLLLPEQSIKYFKQLKHFISAFNLHYFTV